MKTKRNGDISEQACILKTLQLGWNVLRPIGDNLPYDLVLEKENRFIKIQVKTAWKNKIKGGWSVNTIRMQTNKRIIKSLKYKSGDFDFAVAFINETNEFYIFPIAIFLKVKDKLTIGNNKKYEDFKNNWELMNMPS